MTRFATRFQNIDRTCAERLASEFDSPAYLLDESGIHSRLADLQRDALAVYERSRIAISYKTNPTAGVLVDLHRRGALAEVVSGDEYRIARSLGVPTSEIIFNGPAKSDDDLKLAISGNSFLHCDHEDEVTRVQAIAQQTGQVAKIGLRLYFPQEDNWDRFGFPATTDTQCEASRMIGRITESPSLELGGLHAHIGTNVRALDRFQRFAKTYSDFVEWATAEHGIELDWIDLGGGLAGIAPLVSENRFEPFPLPSTSEYCRAVIEPFLPWLDRCEKKPDLFLEPGRTLFNAFGAILVTVIGRRPTDEQGVASVILNAGLTSLHFAWKYNLPVHVCRATRQSADNGDDVEMPIAKPRLTRLLGPTCMEQDVVCRPIMLPELVPGDQLVIFGTGCYSMAMANSFIRFRLGTIGWQADDTFRWLRMPETIEHSRRLDVLQPVEKRKPAGIEGQES